MNKKNITIIILLFLILLVCIGLYLYLSDGEDLTLEETPSREITSIGDLLNQPREGELPIEYRVPPRRPVEDDERRDDRVNIIFEDTIDEDLVEQQPRLVRLFKGPTSGYKVDNLVNSFSVRLVEQGIPNRYIINTDPYTLEQLSYFGEIARVQESHIFNNGKVLLLYESPDGEHIINSVFENFNIQSDGIDTQRFESNIRATTDNENRLFFLSELNDSVVGLVVNVDNPSETKVVWESDFLSWIPRWGRNYSITIQTPLSSYTTTANYLIDPLGERPDKSVGFGSYGSSVFVDEESGYFVLYQADKFNFVGKTIVTNQQQDNIIDVPIILPEKCDGFNAVFVCAVPNIIPVETLSGYEIMFPDSWYQGDIVFNDSLLLIDSLTGNTVVLLSPNDPEIQTLSNGETFDIIDLHISETGEYVFFVNKKDLSLWMLKI